MGIPSSPRSVQLRDRLDRLFVQQLVARRFARDYPADFHRLRSIRDAIHTHILNAGISPLIGESGAQTLTTLMGVYETRGGQQAIFEGNAEYVSANYPLDQFDGILLEEDGLRFAMAGMAPYLEEIKEIQRTYNYFDYFGLIAMTATFSSQSAFKFYLNAATEDTPIYPVFQDIGGNPLANWFYSRQDPEDLDLAIALRVSGRERMFSAPNIKILGSSRTSDISSSKPGHDSIHLKIDLDQAPYNIDYAIRAFRASLYDALLSRHDIAANISRLDDFMKSSFYQQSDSVNLIIQKWSQIQGALIGIWCWDLVKTQNISLTQAMDAILQSQAEIISKASDSTTDINAIGGKAIEKHYYRIHTLLNAEDKCDELSMFVTGDKNIPLGNRV
jgi:hypothetical protein